MDLSSGEDCACKGRLRNFVETTGSAQPHAGYGDRVMHHPRTATGAKTIAQNTPWNRAFRVLCRNHRWPTRAPGHPPRASSMWSTSWPPQQVSPAGLERESILTGWLSCTRSGPIGVLRSGCRLDPSCSSRRLSLYVSTCSPTRPSAGCGHRPEPIFLSRRIANRNRVDFFLELLDQRIGDFVINVDSRHRRTFLSAQSKR